MNPYELVIGDRRLGTDHPTFFLADIAANHDGDLGRATNLIHLAAECGADAAKFQHFTAATIVSDRGFRALGSQSSHQSEWKKSVYEVYQAASLDEEWTPVLRDACNAAGISLVTTPYSLELVDSVAPYVAALKIGSGDITWPEIIAKVAATGLPTLIATGASSLNEVLSAMRELLALTRDVVLMQCNTNYTGSVENFSHVNLNVLRAYSVLFPGVLLGLSDHTPGHAAVLGAVALGARVVEKHFTDEPSREGPDHAFSLSPSAWRDMVGRTRELEAALGSTVKEVAENERETLILQRRSIRLRQDQPAGTTLTREMLEMLRPCPTDGLAPSVLEQVLSKTLTRDLEEGEHLRWRDLV